VGRDGVGGLLSLWGQNENSADEAQDAERGDKREQNVRQQRGDCCESHSGLLMGACGRLGRVVRLHMDLHCA
jgi:hypothetical protein